MHLTGTDVSLLVSGASAVLLAVAAWLRADAAHRSAGKASAKVDQVLNGSAAPPEQAGAAEQGKPAS